MKTINELLNPPSRPYYYYNGIKTYLTTVQDQLLLIFNDFIDTQEKLSTLKSLDKEVGNFIPEISDGLIKDKYLLINLDRVQKDDQLLNTTFPLSELETVSPVYLIPNSTARLALTNQIFIDIKGRFSEKDLTQLYDEYGIIDSQPYGANIFLLTIKQNDKLDALDIANAFYESGYCESAEPNFFRALQSFAFNPNDPYFPYEWHIPKIGADDAWCWTTGANISIGIMDVGINTAHPDLQSNIQGTYDPTGQPLGADGHGTLCAGAAAAIGNNGIGVAGVAYSGRLFQLRIGYNPSTDPNNNNFYSTDAWVVGAVNYAINNNIAIVSCSFSLGSPSSTLNTRFTAYANSARGGLGGIALAATGNDGSNQFIGYPASHPDVLAVGASDFNDSRASFSNWGAGLDFLSPGVFIPTTRYDGGYDTSFSGTSAACPIAAGAVALMLSVNPNLTRTQVRNALASSCDKVGGYTYITYVFEPSSICQEAGYGRINIDNYFKSFFGISDPYLFCGSQQQYQLSNLPAGLSVTWASTNPNLPVNSTGLVTNSTGVPGRTLLTASLSNPCMEPREKIIVSGSFPEEVYAIYQGFDPLNVPWISGNNPNESLPVNNNSVVMGLPCAIYFGYAPSIGKSTLNPPDETNFWMDYQGWNITNNGVTNVEVISVPPTWDYFWVNPSWFAFNTTGDASGTVVVRLQLPCGLTDVYFNIIGI